jgi:hypothetical protein
MNDIIEFGPRDYNAHNLAASTATESSDVRGPTFTNTAYGLLPIKFVEEVVKAAKNEFFFANFVRELTLSEGTSMVSIPVKSIYNSDAGMTWNTAGGESLGSGAGVGPYANTVADISFTALNNMTSVDARPLPHGSGFAVRRWDMRTNVVNLVEDARDELGYAIGARVDITIAKEVGTNDGNTYAQTGTRGTIQLYGGDATTNATLATGDILTTDLIADGARYLKGQENWVRADASGKRGAFTLDTTVIKNGWMNSRDDPFVFFIGPAQEATLRKDSQFVNAAEYGTDEVVQNGEIGKYLGIRIVVTNHIESFAASATGPDDSAVDAGLAGGMTRCILMKGKQAIALVWGMQPVVEVTPWAISDQMLVTVWAYYDIVMLHSDAVVNIDVSNT